MAHDAIDGDERPRALAVVTRDADGWDWTINVARSDVPEMAKHLRDMADAIEANPFGAVH